MCAATAASDQLVSPRTGVQSSKVVRKSSLSVRAGHSTFPDKNSVDGAHCSSRSCPDLSKPPTPRTNGGRPTFELLIFRPGLHQLPNDSRPVPAALRRDRASGDALPPGEVRGTAAWGQSL